MSLPLIAAVFAIPGIIEGLGESRFGILSIAWIVVGYFSIFDLGLGRALTVAVSDKLGAQKQTEVPSVIVTALSLITAVGLLGGVLLYFGTDGLVNRWLNIPPDLIGEALASFSLLAFAVPVVVLSTGLRGVLEAFQDFKLITLIRAPLGAATFLGPALTTPFTPSLTAAVATLVIARVLGFLVYAWFVTMRVRLIRYAHVSLDSSLAVPLLKFGGWMTVSNLVGPAILYADRVIIGGFMTMAAVSYYATPFEIVTKLWFVPAGIVSVFLPAFAFSRSREPERMVSMFSSATRYIFALMMIALLFICAGSYELLRVWLDADFARESGLVLQIMTVGVFINSVAQVPSALLQSVDRPDIKAKIHLAEVVVFVPIVWFAVSRFGVIGAAASFSLRIVFDTIAFFWFTARVVESVQSHVAKTAIDLCTAVFFFCLTLWLTHIEVSSMYVVTIGLLLSLPFCWLRVFSDTERAQVLLHLRRGWRWSK